MKKQLGKLSRYLNLDEDEALTLVIKNAQHAAELAQSYGAESAAQLIPQFDSSVTIEASEDILTTDFPEPDPMLQLNILRDLSSLLESSPNLNLILELTLEGIYRGVGMDRALLALLNRDKNQLHAKYVVGLDNEKLKEKFAFPIDPSMPNIFAMLLTKKTPAWVNAKASSEYEDYMTPHIKSVLGAKQFFLAPIIINQKPIGVFYSDRQPSQRELDNNAYESFKHFAQQACIAIEHLSH